MVRRILGCTLVVVGACGPPADESPPGATVTDSVGVRMVTHPPSAVRVAALDLVERARMGGAGGESVMQLSQVAGGRILEDGTLVVADRMAHAVFQFAPDGALVGRHGREGQGPDEYAYIRALGRCAPEGFTVFDIDWTMSAYGADGRFLEERPMRLEGGVTPYEFACDPSGRMAALEWDRSLMGPDRPMGFVTADARLRILDAAGEEVADLGTRIGSERFSRPEGSGPHPAGRATRLAFAEGALLVADGSFFGWERWSPDGVLRAIVRIDVPPPDLDSLMAAHRALVVGRAETDEARRSAERWSAELEANGPERATHVSELMAREGWILLREPVVGRTGRWFAFTAAGEPVGFLPLSPGARLLDIRQNLLLVEEPDELDVPLVVLYALRDGDRGG